jgi:hypothetical protein
MGSGVVQGQLGVFAVRTLRKGHQLTYDGLRPQHGVELTTEDMTYSVVLDGEVIVDASNAIYASAARYINATPIWRSEYRLSSMPRLTSNCEIVIYENNIVVLELTRTVAAGAELLCDYGSLYWSEVRLMRKLIDASYNYYLGQQTQGIKRLR